MRFYILASPFLVISVNTEIRQSYKRGFLGFHQNETQRHSPILR